MAEKKDSANKKVKRPTAQKRDLQNEKRRLQNKAFRSRVNTAINSFKGSVATKDAANMRQTLNNVFSLMDKGVKVGVYKNNKAARVKSRLNRIVQTSI